MKERPTIIVDSREQEPFGFDCSRVSTVRKALAAGDYALLGRETEAAVERKTLDDLVSTVIGHRRRFHEELRLLSACAHSCVVVEAELDDVFSHRYRSGADPRSVLGAVVSIVVDFHVPVFFCGSRAAACAFTEAYLLRCHERLRKHDSEAGG